MGFFGRLFGTKAEGGDQGADGEKTRDVVMLNEGDAPIRIDPHSITHAFVALTHKELDRTDAVKDEIANLNRACQPQLWSVQFRAKFVTFTADESDSGYPDVSSVPAALTEIGLSPQSSIVINDAVVSFDGGQSQSKIFVGFAFRDRKPRIILPYHDACIPR